MLHLTLSKVATPWFIIIVILYCLLFGPLWYYLLESFAESDFKLGLKEEGDLYVFIPEENKKKISIIMGEEEGDAFSSESDWYGKLPRIMDELEKSKKREEEMSQKLERLEKLEEDMAILKEFIMGERK